MPYGIDKKIGGDSPANVKFMEKCVRRVMGKKDKRKGGKLDKESAIRICKKTLQKSKGNAAVASLLMHEYFNSGKI